jgi:hypothetical protein
MRDRRPAADADGMNRNNSRAAHRWRTALKLTGLVLFVLTGVGGLAVIGFFVVVLVGLSQWGSNK